MTQVKTIIKWALGLLILIGGIKTLTEGRPIGLFHVAFGLFFLPPVLSFVEIKMKFAVPRVAKYVIAVGGFVAIGLIETNFQKGVSGPYLQKASEWIETGNLDSAMRYVKLAKQVFPDSVANPAFTQGREIQLFQSEDFYIQSMAELSQAEADQLAQGKLTKKFFENNTLNNRFNERLNQASDTRLEIVKQYEKSKSIKSQSGEVNCSEEEQMKGRESPTYAGAWATVRERYQYYLDAKDPRFVGADIESTTLDSTIFFTPDNNSCLVITLQLKTDSSKPDKIFVFGGRKTEGIWRFYIHKRFYDIKKDPGFESYPKAYRLKELREEVIRTILSEGDTSRAPCIIDEGFWFGSIWMTP